MTTIILHIEASTETCSVALSQDGHVFFERVNHDARSHAKVLAPFVEEALQNADNQGNDNRENDFFLFAYLPVYVHETKNTTG